MSIPEVQAQLIVRISQDTLLHKDDVGPALLIFLHIEDVLPLNPSACTFLNSVMILMGFQGRVRICAEAV